MRKRQLLDHLWSGGGGGGGGGYRSISLTGMRIQGQVSSTPKRNDSKFKQKNQFFLASRERFTHRRCKKLTTCQL